MTVDSHLGTLMELANQLGYSIDRRPNCDGIKIHVHPGQPKRVRIDPSMSRTQQLVHVGTCLANDPQLAWYELDADQEAALQMSAQLASDAKIPTVGDNSSKNAA